MTRRDRDGGISSTETTRSTPTEDRRTGKKDGDTIPAWIAGRTDIGIDVTVNKKIDEKTDRGDRREDGHDDRRDYGRDDRREETEDNYGKP